jgi:hypothetical protein
VQDIVTRYASTTGHHVSRRFGWDCHGLPVEYEIDQKLGIKSKDDVLKLGIGNYNEECRSIVMRYSKVSRPFSGLGSSCPLTSRHTLLILKNGNRVIEREWLEILQPSISWSSDSLAVSQEMTLLFQSAEVTCSFPYKRSHPRQVLILTTEYFSLCHSVCLLDRMSWLG